jgi:CRP/FNR family transcriptional regulator
MAPAVATQDALKQTTLFRRLSSEDRARIAAVSHVREYGRGDRIFSEGDPCDFFVSIVTGRVKVFKATPAGKEIILEIFGPGDPLGAVAVYEGNAFPASATAIEPATCLILARRDFFQLLEQNPSMVRGVLTGLTTRLVELTRRITELTGGRVETRFARLFLKLADQMGQADRGGVFIPMPLSRQELADLTGTTIETCIRIMSRWGKDEVLRTEKDGFVILDRVSLESLAAS